MRVLRNSRVLRTICFMPIVAAFVLLMVVILSGSRKTIGVNAASTGVNNGPSWIDGNSSAKFVGLDALGYSCPSSQFNCRETTRSQM